LNEIRLQVNKRKGAHVNVKIALSEGSEVEEILAEIPERIDSMAIECATMLAGEVIEHEVTALCGERYARDGSRKATRYGSQRGSITIAGRKVGIEKPRVRAADGGGEIDLSSYRRLRRKGAMGEAVLERMARGVSCRNYEGVVTASCEGFGMKKSSVSRDFIKASAARLKELVERRLDGERFVAIFIDGIVYAGATMIVALGVSIKGDKTILGLRQGATENSEVCAELLQSIVARGVDPILPTLFILDGSKALKAATTRVWGDNAVIQRCRQHKKENVRAHLAKCSWEELDWRLAQAFHEDNYSEALRKLKATASWLEKINPDATASLNEGMEELLTVTRLKLPLVLTKSLVTTNPIESVFSTVRSLTRRVSTWKDKDMRLRWCATALLQVEPRLIKLRGRKYLPVLAQNLDSLLKGSELDRLKDVA
jgi:putative transposase